MRPEECMICLIAVERQLRHNELRICAALRSSR